MRFILTSLFALALLITPAEFATAQGFIICQGDSCNACSLVSLIQRLLQFLITLAILFGTLMIMLAGFKMVTAHGNQAEIKKAKEIFTNVAIGITIILLAFTIVDTLMKMLVPNSSAFMGGGPWSTIQCADNNIPKQPAPSQPSSPVTVTPGGGQNTGGSTSGIPFNGPTMTADEAKKLLTERGIAVNSGVNLEGISSDVIDKIVAASNDMGPSALIITSARDGTHMNTCHAAGTCLDVVCRSCGSDAGKIQAFINAADNHRYCAVYEPGPSGGCPAGVSRCRAGVGTGAHYSFYMGSGAKDSLCN